MMTTKQFISVTCGAFLLLTFACKKDKNSKTGIPELTTTEVTNVLISTAMSGGTVTNNGGETIVANGVCWSKTSNNPTISDDTTKSTLTSGSFTAMLKNLVPSTTYYVRAYATNRYGTGYGNIVTFSVGNGAPVATGIAITGIAKADELITGNYTYNDHENDGELGTTFQWYVANDNTGAGETPIIGATAKTFRIMEAQQGKYVRFGVIPKASIGTQNIMEFKSAFIGAVGDATTVTFSYNGTEVTYGIISSTTTGKKWLDRNLGASRFAQNVNDYQAYGDLFQWGRVSDGHQLVTRVGPNDVDATGVNGVTSAVAPYETSSSDIPSTNKFIINNALSGDWRDPQAKIPLESRLWQGVDGTNNPCPKGWRIPTQEEWIAEGLNSITDAYEKLKITYTGYRSYSDGIFKLSATTGYYWTSNVYESSFTQFSYRYRFNITSASAIYTNRGNAYPCRCVKN